MIRTQLSVGSAHPTESAGTARPTEGRLIVDPPQPGAWNMALDEALLLDAAERGVATLRFYQWSEPTLSLGYFQCYEERHQHAASRACAVVRRQTGGGAILHDRELTYSIVLPAAHPLARESELLYTAVHEAFIHSIKTILAGGNEQWTLSRENRSAAALPDHEPFLCFERRARGDVLLCQTARGNTCWKILGSAQRRRRGAILQHGSLLLERSPAAPELPGLFDLTGRSFPIDDLVPTLTAGLVDACGSFFQPATAAHDLHSKMIDFANHKYRSAAWTKRR